MVFVSDSSGRFVTSYVPDCLVNQKIKDQVGIKDNYSYRMYLQRNAAKLMDLNKISPVEHICDCPRCNLISKKKFFS